MFDQLTCSQCDPEGQRNGSHQDIRRCQTDDKWIGYRLESSADTSEGKAYQTVAKEYCRNKQCKNNQLEVACSKRRCYLLQFDFVCCIYCAVDLVCDVCTCWYGGKACFCHILHDNDQNSI